jgi:L-2-hydroxyglutarate oxidase LhgO
LESVDVVVVGAGILGLAAARALLSTRPDLSVAVIEKEERLAVHQSGHNSGVIHSGIYYEPGSNKATMVAAGRDQLLEYCQSHGVDFELCGKVVVATTVREVGALHALQIRAEQNGVTAALLRAEEIAEHEPHVNGLAALHVPSTGIVDFRKVSVAYATEVEDLGGRIHLGTALEHVDETSGALRLTTSTTELEAGYLVNCAGLQSDRVAALAGAPPEGMRIMPFRGEYHALVPEARHLVRNLVYPVPDPRLPFLGVHATRMIDGSVHVGPNAVAALAREGYSWRDIDQDDVKELVTSPATLALARTYWRTGIAEVVRSVSEGAFVRELQRLIPAVRAQDVEPAEAGVRAQAIGDDGRLVDDFVFTETARVVNVVNAPSPAATASLEIGRHIAGKVLQRMAERFG